MLKRQVMIMEDYNGAKIFWNNIFNNIKPDKYEKTDLGQEDLNEASKWLSDGTDSIIDFGCGSGTFLFDSALRGTRHHIGIDISMDAIALAKEREKLFETGNFEFIQGGLECLNQINDNTMDGAILSNIVDNMTPQDAELILNNIHRIVHVNGKILFKVNPFLSKEQIREWGIKELGDNLLLDGSGMYLYNLKTDKWCSILKKYFSIYLKKDIYFKQHEQYNRLFLLINRKDGNI